MAEVQEQEGRKILLMGLDNSGKSSILFNLQKASNILSLYSLTPTPGLNIVSYVDQGVKFYIWDFGGQERYREKYSLQLDEYTFKVNEIIFVIDIQDPERYDLALGYLQEIIESLKKNQNKDVKLSIYLHKYEPTLEKDDKFSAASIKLELFDKIRAMLSPEIKCHFYKTRIYTVLEKSSLEF